MMSVAYAVVITQVVLTVQERLMEATGQVTVVAYQIIMMEMIVMIVQGQQMVMQN